MTTPQEARELAEHYADTTLVKPALRSLASQVEALTAQLDSYAMALNETKAERDNLINLLENSWQGWFPAVHDGAGFDRHEFVFKSSERDLRIAIKGTACKGFEIEPGVFSGCNQSAGDCPACGK